MIGLAERQNVSREANETHCRAIRSSVSFGAGPLRDATVAVYSGVHDDGIDVVSVSEAIFF